MSNGNPSQKRRSRHKADIEPITLDELLSGAGMSGFLGILDPPVAVPHLQKLVDEIRVDTPATVSSQDTVLSTPTGSSQDTVAAGDAVGSQDTVSADVPAVASQDTVLSPPGVSSPDTVSFHATASSCPTVVTQATVSSDDTVSRLDTVAAHATVSRPDTVAPHAAPGHARVRPVKSVHDGHTKAEQLLYAAMWAAGRPEHPRPDAPRILTGGYDQLSSLSGLYWSAVKRNLQSLQTKLAIETIASENSNERVGRTYRIYCAAAILDRRRNAGLTLVRRWRGSVELLSGDTVSAAGTVSPPIPVIPDRHLT